MHGKHQSVRFAIWIMLLLVIIFPSQIGAANYKDLTGYWEGQVEYGDQKFLIAITFETGKILSATIDIPQKGAICVPLAKINCKNRRIKFEIPGQNPVYFKGKLKAESITGSFKQGDIKGKFYISKTNQRWTIEELISMTSSSTNNTNRKILYFPASPQDGFYWPYFLALPDDSFKDENIQFKRYLMVDINNVGQNDIFDDCLKKTYATVLYRGPYSMQVAEELWMPLLYPAFPRPNLWYRSENKIYTVLTHSFDRDTATLHWLINNPDIGLQLKQQCQNINLDITTICRLDLQLMAMIRHAQKYLTNNGYQLESKVFLCGYSASGTFTDRFTALHPEIVKAVASGATLDDMILPLKEYQEEKLIFPIGTYDYHEIVGRDFNINKHNALARLIYMGEDDDNNVVNYNDCYGAQEQKIIIKLWGREVLPRAQKLIELYGQSGGKGIFILDKGIKHSYSQKMKDYIKEFFKANRDSLEPVYPLPADTSQLKYVLYQ